jgi:hypothetical protein
MEVRHVESRLYGARDILIVRVLRCKLGQLAYLHNLVTYGLFNLLQESRVCMIL